MAGGYKRATQRKHRRMIDNRNACRRAGIAADQLGKNGLRFNSNNNNWIGLARNLGIVYRKHM
jgi:hypothetical protein